MFFSTFTQKFNVSVVYMFWGRAFEPTSFFSLIVKQATLLLLPRLKPDQEPTST